MTDQSESRQAITMDGSGLLQGRIAVITGASRGIGAAVARRFAAEGATLILLARTVGGLEEVDDAIRLEGGQQAVLVPHDLRKLDDLDRLGASLYERFGHIDILVGAAGILGNLMPIGHFNPKLWTEIFDVNVTANWRLIRALDPLLRRSKAGRAIFVTAADDVQGQAYWGAYAASKAALESLVRSYAAELGKTSVRANLVAPAPTRTALRAQAFPGENPKNLIAPEDLASGFVELARPECQLQGQIVRLP